MAYVVAVTFEIVPGQMNAFLPLMRDNAAASVREEPGCRQFDVCSDSNQPDAVFLYEVYDNRAAFDAHLQSPHFRSFDAATASMIAHKVITTFDRADRNPA